MAKGDWIKVRRGGITYAHHGIDCGDGTVIHFSGEPKHKDGASVRRDPMETFLAGSKLHVVKEAPWHKRNAIMRRAKEALGTREYNLVINNCEHFARWAFEGTHSSAQVTRGGAAVAAGMGTAAAVGVGVPLASSMVTVLGSQTLGAAALGLGLVSAPVWPVIAVGVGSAVVVGGTVYAVQRLARRRQEPDDVEIQRSTQ